MSLKQTKLKFFVCLLYNIYKEKMFTIEIEDGREAKISALKG